MKDASIIQSYMLCAVNEKGKISDFNTESRACLVAAGLLELRLDRCIAIEDKKVGVTGVLPADKPYLEPLYAFIEPKPVRLEKLAEVYNNGMSDKKLDELTDAVGDSLDALGMLEEVKTGLLGGKSYRPEKSAVTAVIDRLRAGLLGNVPVTDEVAAIAILLSKGKCLKPYFSAFEQREIKDRLRAFADTPDGKTVKMMVDAADGMVVLMAAMFTTMN